MPPKDLFKWDNRKLMVKSVVNGEWVEATEIKENPILEPFCAPCDTFDTPPVSFRVSVQATFKHRTRLFQELGLWKRPKLTYKTNRHYKRPKHHRKH
jgi:hypothetical protein